MSQAASGELPDLICVITGKGDLKEFYLARIAEASLRHVTILTPWLHAADYPRYSSTWEASLRYVTILTPWLHAADYPRYSSTWQVILRNVTILTPWLHAADYPRYSST